MSIKHAPPGTGIDMTLCGLANEAGDDGDVTGETSNPEYAQINERVTCPDCRRLIDHVYASFAPRTYMRRL